MTDTSLVERESDTPMTDAFMRECEAKSYPPAPYPVFDFARKLERECAELRRDGERLQFVMDDIDGFVGVKLDRYDYAIQVATENGRSAPNAEDELNGIRRLIDAARKEKP